MQTNKLLPGFDWTLLLTTTALCLIGLTVIYSAGFISETNEEMSGSSPAMWRQAFAMALGSAGFVLCVLIRPNFWRSCAWLFYIVGCALLILVLFKGTVAGGAADPVSCRDLRRSALCTGGRGHGGRVSAGDMGGAVGGGISPCPAAAEPVGADGACIVRRMVLSYGKHQQQRRISHERAHQPGGGVGRPAEV